MNVAPETTDPPTRGARGALLRYAVAVCSVAAGLVLRLALRAALSGTVPYITFFPAVMLAAWFGGLGPGLLATALSLAAAFYFAIEPFRFDASNVAHLTGAISKAALPT